MASAVVPFNNYPFLSYYYMNPVMGFPGVHANECFNYI